MKTASWFMAIAKDDEEALQAFELLRKRGCFNTRLWRWNTRDEMQLIRRYYIYPKKPMLEIQRRRLYGAMDCDEQQLADHLDYLYDSRERQFEDIRKSRKREAELKSKIRDLERQIKQLEAEKAELRKECMTEDGLHDYSEVADIVERLEAGWRKQIEEAEAQAQYMDEAFAYAIQCGLAPGWSELPDINQFGIEKDKIGSEEFVAQVAEAIERLKSGSNARFVTPDMSATLGRGTHVLIDVDKVPKELQVLLAKMMDTLNNHTLRISNLENC